MPVQTKQSMRQSRDSRFANIQIFFQKYIRCVAKKSFGITAKNHVTPTCQTEHLVTLTYYNYIDKVFFKNYM